MSGLCGCPESEGGGWLCVIQEVNGCVIVHLMVSCVGVAQGSRYGCSREWMIT